MMMMVERLKMAMSIMMLSDNDDDDDDDDRTVGDDVKEDQLHVTKISRYCKSIQIQIRYA